MPSTPANAAAFVRSFWRKAICWSTSQLAAFRLPPYRPGAEPRTPVVPSSPPEGAAGVAVGEAGAEESFAVDSV